MTSNGKFNGHIALDDDGLPGQWVDVANIGLRSPKQFQKVQALASDNSVESARAFVAEIVTAWNILDPITGNPIPPPNSPDLDLNDLPMIATKRFTEHIQDQFEAIVPKARS